MKRWLWLLLIASAVSQPALAENVRGVVIVVIDGDTVLFKPDYTGARSRAFLKIRLADIDAPEKDQAYGDAATRALAALVLNQSVEVNTVATDVYGRRIAHLNKDTLQVNIEMLRLGLAWAYDSTSRYRRNAASVAAQEEARLARRGLWAETTPTPPWVWRRAQYPFVN
ncbi:MAG: thermonuclease family protein [Thiobacillus sp.]|nr:thermonuclease family protein [Thiobacillus sp.]